MILAFPAETDFQGLDATYGEVLPLSTLDSSEGTAKTIIGCQDVKGSAALRAGIIGKTAMPITLTDGRLALSGTFSQPLLDTIASGTIAASILTDAKFSTLIPQISMA